MDLGIAGKRALVLGGSKGLGYASALALAHEGVDLMLASSSRDRCADAAGRIAAETGATVHAAEGDVSDPDNMDRLFAEAEAALGGVDILFNNQGGPPLGPASEVDEAALMEQFTKLVTSPIRLTRACIPGMVARGWGRILFVGSRSMIQPQDNRVLTNSLRNCIVGYAKTLAGELAADNVTVNILGPGSILTDRTRQSNAANAKRRGVSEDEIMAERVKNAPAGRLGDVGEFGALAAFLCGQAAGYMTGSLWRVEGGAVRSII